MEFSFAGNLRYPHLSEANTWEWLHDRGGVDWLQLIDGDSGFGGLAAVDCDWNELHLDSIAFRPLVVFHHN